MKYLKHVLSILIFLTIDQFILENIAVYITTVFNGSITFMILCLLMLQIFLISFIVLWMKKEIPLNFKIPYLSHHFVNIRILDQKYFP